MAGKLSQELYQETQLGQILLQGGVISGDNAAAKVEDVAKAQKSQPDGSRKLIGQMLVEAGLCTSKDVDASLEVQKAVRTELGEMQDKGLNPTIDNVKSAVESAYQQYEKSHPDYHRPEHQPDKQQEGIPERAGDQHASLEIPSVIKTADGNFKFNPHAVALAEHAFGECASPAIKFAFKSPEAQRLS